MLMSVKPGMVFTSLTTRLMSGRRKKSTRAIASQPSARNANRDMSWTRATTARGRSAELCRECIERSDVGDRDRPEARDRQAGIAQQPLRRILVHGGGRAEDARADERHAGKLRHALHRAVFTERTVQHRKDDIDRRGI